jgi:predicted nucleic acid-binding protein
MAELLLDTGVLIQHLRKRNTATSFLIQRGQLDSLYISVVTRVEILAGMRPQEEALTLELVRALNNLPVDDLVADRAGRMIYTLARKGVQISFPDALIAATALQHRLAVVTTNVAHFQPTGVQLQRWE